MANLELTCVFETLEAVLDAQAQGRLRLAASRALPIGQETQKVVPVRCYLCGEECGGEFGPGTFSVERPRKCLKGKVLTES